MPVDSATIRRWLTIAVVLLLTFVAAWATLPSASAHAACSSTFEVPIEEETGEDLEGSPDDEVIEIALGKHRSRTLRTWASCDGESSRRKANPNPGFGVFPGDGRIPRRIFDERRDQAGRDADELSSARKKRAKSKRSAKR